jgi:hypothetical protein
MNVEDFFELCRTHPEERYEYIHGYAYRLMAGGDSNHSLIKMNVYREFGNALRGGPSRAYDSDMHVRITDDQFVLPDASVSCRGARSRDHESTHVSMFNCRGVVAKHEKVRPGTEVGLLQFCSYHQGVRLDQHKRTTCGRASTPAE